MNRQPSAMPANLKVDLARQAAQGISGRSVLPFLDRHTIPDVVESAEGRNDLFVVRDDDDRRGELSCHGIEQIDDRERADTVERGAGVVTAALAVVVILRKPRPIAAGLGLLATLSAVWWAFAEGQAPRSAILLPTGLRFDIAQGGGITAGDLRGRPAVLNLWASWRPPCRREMPMLIDTAARERRAAILLVNQGETPARLHAFLRGQGLSSRHVALIRKACSAPSPALPPCQRRCSSQQTAQSGRPTWARFRGSSSISRSARCRRSMHRAVRRAVCSAGPARSWPVPV